MEFQVRYGGPVLLGLLVLPWLIQKATGQLVFNPISELLTAVIFPSINLLLGLKGQLLFGSALLHYLPYLPWG